MAASAEVKLGTREYDLEVIEHLAFELMRESDRLM